MEIMLPEDAVYERECKMKIESCEHEWQHFKFVDNTTTRFDCRKPFTLAYYCRKCLKIRVEPYAPLLSYLDDSQRKELEDRLSEKNTKVSRKSKKSALPRRQPQAHDQH